MSFSCIQGVHKVRVQFNILVTVELHVTERINKKYRKLRDRSLFWPPRSLDLTPLNNFIYKKIIIKGPLKMHVFLFPFYRSLISNTVTKLSGF